MAEKLEVVGFTSFDDPTYPTTFLQNPEMHMEIIDVVTKYIKNNHLCYSGEDHQNHPLGVPVLSNGTAFRCSMRFWGSLMGSVYSSKEDYMSYYMEVEEATYPEVEVEVEPSKEKDGLPSFSKEDASLMQESLQMNIDLFTTDKALQIIYPKLKLYKEMEDKSKEERDENITIIEEKINFTIKGEDVEFIHIADVKENGHTYGVCFHNEKGVAIMDIKEDGSYTFLSADTDMELIRSLMMRVRDELIKRK